MRIIGYSNQQAAPSGLAQRQSGQAVRQETTKAITQSSRS